MLFHQFRFPTNGATVMPAAQNRPLILALPSEVNSLFALLIVGALMSSVNAGCYVYTLVRFGDPGMPLLTERPRLGSTGAFSPEESEKLMSQSGEALVG